MPKSSYNPDYTGVGVFLKSDALLEMVESVAETIKARAIAISPVGSYEERDRHPGLYISSFHVRTSRDGGATGDRVEAVMYNDSPDAVWVEYGHRGREPYAVIRRAAFEVTI